MASKIENGYEKTKDLLRQMVRSEKTEYYPLDKAYRSFFSCYFCGRKINSAGRALMLDNERFYVDDVCYKIMLTTKEQEQKTLH